jgi:hypothetical protein
LPPQVPARAALPGTTCQCSSENRPTTSRRNPPPPVPAGASSCRAATAPPAAQGAHRSSGSGPADPCRAGLAPGGRSASAARPHARRTGPDPPADRGEPRWSPAPRRCGPTPAAPRRCPGCREACAGPRLRRRRQRRRAARWRPSPTTSGDATRPTSMSFAHAAPHDLAVSTLVSLFCATTC